ncbi:hypothetical protein B0H14DRAFT_2178391, partial [Mycena olivaceomarginata]
MCTYYFDKLPSNQCLLHNYVPLWPVPEETLSMLNLHVSYIPVEGYEPAVDTIALECGYKNHNTVTINISKEGMIRYILSGSGFFDMRETPSDAWIHLVLDPGNLV